MLSSGDSRQVNALDSASGKPARAKWTISDPTVASIDSKGVVTGLKKGDAVITAFNPKNDTIGSCIVSVDVPFQNPILPPSWKLYIADPEPKVFGNGVYVYGSRDEGGNSWCSDKYNVLYSEDLVHWTDKGVSFHLDSVPEQYMKPKYRRLWAPDALKHPTNGRYYLFSCFNHTRPVAEEELMVSYSDKPGGWFTDAKPLKIDGKEPIIAIDPGVLVDEDGKAYVTWPFKMGQLDPDDYTRVIGSTVVDVQQWMPEDNTPFEGPSIRKRGDTYYYIYIQNDGLRNRPDGTQYNKPTRMAYMTSKSPLGPYTYQGLIMENTDYPQVINIHGSIVEFKDQWYVFYHMPVIDKRLTRVMCAEPLTFDEEGKIIPVKPSTSGIRGAFKYGDRIQASGAVVYPGGEMNPQYVSRENDAKLVFQKQGSFAGYRYIDLDNNKAAEVVLDVNTSGAGGVLEIRYDGADGETLAVVTLPDTGGEWKEVTAKVSEVRPGKQSFIIGLKEKPASGDVELDWLQFNEAAVSATSQSSKAQ
ncbi:xylan 1,4-beta-xylosidase [Flammeovirgaceae bacterium 311]|nr:xylan 1,4-beta-xylosidase [Flammeovirgaceae bacterium 311]